MSEQTPLSADLPSESGDPRPFYSKLGLAVLGILIIAQTSSWSLVGIVPDLIAQAVIGLWVFLILRTKPLTRKARWCWRLAWMGSGLPVVLYLATWLPPFNFGRMLHQNEIDSEFVYASVELGRWTGTVFRRKSGAPFTDDKLILRTKHAWLPFLENTLGYETLYPGFEDEPFSMNLTGDGRIELLGAEDLSGTYSPGEVRWAIPAYLRIPVAFTWFLFERLQKE